MPHRVFVSSTFSDLKEHREAVLAGIRQLGAHEVAMENFGARDERPKDECVRVIREESDFFVGIYAHRYGHVPHGDAVSITETEYEAASQARLPRLIYLVDDATPWMPQYIDRGSAADQLEALKRRLRSRHVYRPFGTPDQLRADVCADLGREILRRELARVGNPGEPSTAVDVHVTPDGVDEWNAYRYAIYAEQHDVFLVHTAVPSSAPGQRFDAFIYLARHHSSDLSVVRHAEFFLGPYWGNRVFKVENRGGYIGITVSAFAAFLCTCRITFRHGRSVRTSRYVDYGLHAGDPTAR